jgi:uncharacterized protein
MASTGPDRADALTSFFGASPREGVISAYLFGSHATGHAHRESDVDVAVLLDRRVFPSVRYRFEARIALIGELAAALRTDGVDLVVLNEAPPHLVRRIMTDGIRILCLDAEADHAARRTALLRAADLEPFLRRVRATKLRAIAR